MTEPTKTRVELRREICKDLRMPFFRRFGAARDVETGGADFITDLALETPNDIYSGQWLYITTNDEQRLVVDHLGEQAKLVGEYDFDTEPDNTDDYEILQTWNAQEIHDAINEGIREGFPAFFSVVEDESVIIQEDALEYTLANLATTMWRPLKMWIERTALSMMGEVDSVTATTLVDAALIGKLGDVDTGWYVSIYSGTGKGQLRQVVSATDGTGTITVATWTTNPDTTSKYRLWDPSQETYDWVRWEAARFEPKEWPNKFYLFSNQPQFYGLRVRLQYLAQPPELADEEDTTVVPPEYIKEKAKSILYGQMVDDSRYNRQRYASLEEYHRQQAEMYKMERAFEWPDGTRWHDHQTMGLLAESGASDPLGWIS